MRFSSSGLLSRDSAAAPVCQALRSAEKSNPEEVRTVDRVLPACGISLVQVPWGAVAWNDNDSDRSGIP
jgi:hypothetical protein